ncbi:signal transducer and activator of transcription 1-alpha/beta-like [Archocentrus centrarchus]|uniref:signal transducer and activator of transcription 1-alpha/beta-like n=1 Tax=Archocentrus centrarchus TaxID=63155 RepID=UPI0011E9C2E4|nr:signal transducer and activator of transcription 1-alpha/beta-like [Archocentrus centrarchus]
MAQWQALLKLDSALQSRVCQLYEKRFPKDIRHYLCVWIENQDWDSAAVDENRARTCFQALLVFLEEQWKRSIQENIILQGPDFSSMRDYLLAHFQDEPLNLAVLLSECLKEEKQILASVCEVQSCSNPTMGQSWEKLDNQVNELKRQTLEIRKELKTLEDLNEKLDFLLKTWTREVEEHARLAQSQAVFEEECQKQAWFITQTKQIVQRQLVNILKQTHQVVETLTDVELPEWKRRQQLACIGSPAETNLDLLEKWFSTVAEVLLGVHEQLKKLQDLNSKYSSTNNIDLPASISEIEKFALLLIMKLLTNALVVVKQPVMQKFPQRPLILKTGVQFSMTVRFLVNIPEFKCKFKVKPVFDKDVEEANTVKGFRLFDFNRDDCKVLDEDTDGGLMAEFGHMSLKERKSRTKGSAENRLGVTEELHIIKFVSEFQHAGQTCNIEASSLPVVVISSTSQVPSAWASIMWWNVLSTSEPWNLSLFINPPPLTWEQLSQALSWQFLTVGQRGLNENQLSMLRDKIVDDPDGLVHWSNFSKNENAWIWIDGILDLIKKHLVDLWRDGSIMGFVSRERTRLLLQEKQAGNFLIRFSESSKDGAVTFSWVDQSNGEPHVHAVQPYTKKELSVLTLPDIIYRYSLSSQRSRNPLVYLYPDIPKDTAFGRYKSCDPSAPSGDGYHRRIPSFISNDPTPPPSPPSETLVMDMDIDAEKNAYLDELISSLVDSLSPAVTWGSHLDTFQLQPLSPQSLFADGKWERKEREVHSEMQKDVRKRTGEEEERLDLKVKTGKTI